MNEQDIDLGGGTADDLPPGVLPGTLAGENPSEEEQAPDPVQLGDQAALEEGESPQAGDDPEPDVDPLTGVATPPEREPEPEPAKRGGSVSRTYKIFQQHQAEVQGTIVEAFVEVMEVGARNGEGALRKAGKELGEGFSGTLVATPATYWSPKSVNTKPTGGVAVRIG